MAAVNDGRMFDTPFNVVAAFRSQEQADAAARRLTSYGLSESSVEVQTGPDAGGPVETAELRADMQDELGGEWGMMTGLQTRGAVIGTTTFAIIGLGIGLIVGLIAGLFFGEGASVLFATIVGGIIGLVGGATAGFVAGGGVAPRVRSAAEGRPEDFDDPRPPGECDVLLAVHATEPEIAERAARILRDEVHADRVHLVDAAGTPLPPQAGKPRPADPDEYWWRAAGEG
jgi:hypothetical protein